MTEQDGQSLSRTEWAAGLAGELRRLDPRQAAALRLVYGRRISFDEAARVLDVTVEEFVATLGAAMRNLGRLLSTPGAALA